MMRNLECARNFAESDLASSVLFCSLRRPHSNFSTNIVAEGGIIVKGSFSGFLTADVLIKEHTLKVVPETQTKFSLLNFLNSLATIDELTSAQIALSALRIRFKLLSFGLVS